MYTNILLYFLRQNKFFDIATVLCYTNNMNAVINAIKTNIANPNTIFVFPTNISATTWSEYILDQNITQAVALERFIAWDSFKSECIRSNHQTKNSIPSMLRKFFALSVIQKNKEKKLFHSLINPDFIETSSSFSDWISTLLPQLASWYEKRKKSDECDNEDKDLLILKNEYETFLEENKLFEPAWEKPPFYDNGKRYIVIYPEIFQDYLEYKTILEQATSIELIHIDENNTETEVLQYTNTRSELKDAALFIRDLCNKNSLTWSDIAVSINDLENIEAYIKQEFSLYNIPYRFRSGKKLAEYAGGRLFSLIQSCYFEKFSFDSVKNLVLNPVFPWKDSIVAEQLIDFGVNNNCLCTYDNLDVWELAFNKAPKEHRAFEFYKKLKKSITNIATATNFSYLKMHYFVFRDDFFNVAEISEETNRIVSRSISELTNIIDLENSYPKITACNDPLSFFIEQLKSIEYVVQAKENGVNIFSYKLASTAPYKQHIILDASQNALTVTNQTLSFLREEKRKALNIKDENTSALFIKLYKLHSENSVRFSYSQNSFSGFEIPYNSLIPKEIFTNVELNTKDNTTTSKMIDAYYQEKQLFLENTTKIANLHSLQHEGFFNWKKIVSDSNPEAFLQNLKTIIEIKAKKNERLQVSATALNKFYECPIKWLLSDVLDIKDFTRESTLLDTVLIGTFYHEVIKRVLLKLKEEKRPLSIEKDNTLPADINEFIEFTTKDVVHSFPDSCDIRGLSNLTVEVFKAQIDIYIKNLVSFFTEFSLWFQGSFISETEKTVCVSMQNYDIVGKIDCVLDFPGNEFIEQGKYILDFKTVKLPSRHKCIKEDNRDLKNFQLPLYIYLYEQSVFNGKPAVQGCAFMSIHHKKILPLLGTLKIDGKQENPRIKKDKLQRIGENEYGCTFETTLEATQTAITEFTSAILDTNLSLFTNQKLWGKFPSGESVSFETCLSCNFNKICRLTYIISGVKH